MEKFDNQKDIFAALLFCLNRVWNIFNAEGEPFFFRNMW